jgi:hypothetical protein
MELFGLHGYQASKKDGISGQFNRAMFGRIMVVAEETDWAGDKKAEAVWKDLKTGKTININPKGIDEFTTANFARFITTGNPDWVAPISESGRRDTAFKFGPLVDRAARAARRKLMRDMWRELKEEGGYEAFLRDLEALDPDAIDLREPFLTDGRVEQKLLSLSTLDKFLVQLLTDGLIETDYNNGFGGINCAPTDALTDALRAFAGQTGDHGRKASATEIGARLEKIYGPALGPRRRASAIKCRYDDRSNLGNRITESKERPWCRDLPPLPVARELFLKFHNVDGEEDSEGATIVRGRANWFPHDPKAEWVIRCKDPRGRVQTAADVQNENDYLAMRGKGHK